MNTELNSKCFRFSILWALYTFTGILSYVGLKQTTIIAFTPLLIYYCFIVGKIIFGTESKIHIWCFFIILIGVFCLLLHGIGKDLIYLKHCLSIFIMPFVMYSCFVFNNNKKNHDVLNKHLYAFFLIECFLSIFERAIGYNFFEEREFYGDINYGFRATGLFGEPLTNSVFVAVCCINYLFDPYRSKKEKIFIYLISLFAILSFNSRSVFLLLILLGLYIYIVTKKVSFKSIILIISSICIFGYVLLNTKWGGRLVYNDELIDGSAMTRVEIWNFTKYVSSNDLLLGNYKNAFTILDWMQLRAATIENGIIVLILLDGIIVTILFICTSTYLMWKRLCQYKKKLDSIIMLCFILILYNLNNAYSNGTLWIALIMSLFIINNHSFIKYRPSICKK